MRGGTPPLRQRRRITRTAVRHRLPLRLRSPRRTWERALRAKAPATMSKPKYSGDPAAGSHNTHRPAKPGPYVIYREMRWQRPSANQLPGVMVGVRRGDYGDSAPPSIFPPAARNRSVPSASARLEADQALHHRALAVDPAIVGGACDHRVFAGHLVDEVGIPKVSFTRRTMSR